QELAADGHPDAGTRAVALDQIRKVAAGGLCALGGSGVLGVPVAFFHVLGGLGVLVGSIGVGLVTARNLAERRYEFAILHTLGVPGVVTRRVVLLEVGEVIRWGLGIGLVAALVSILPSISTGDFVGSVACTGLWVLLIGLNAWFCSWLGYRRQIGTALRAQREFQ
ncbi:MAG: hypothetical protein N2A42_00240, partial [Luteolibacter sp.]